MIFEYLGKSECLISPHLLYNYLDKIDELINFKGTSGLEYDLYFDVLPKAGLRLPYFHLEDVFITGFSAEWCNVPRYDNQKKT